MLPTLLGMTLYRSTLRMRDNHASHTPMLICPSSLQVFSEGQAPSGCAVNVLDDTITFYLMLKGLLDPVKEAAKLRDRLVSRISMPMCLINPQQDVRKNVIPQFP